jgi:prevent-host-death family protein
MADSLPLATVKNRFSELVDRVNREHDRVVVTRNGVPAVVMVSVDELEGLEETLEIMSDPALMASVQAADQEVAEGWAVPISETAARARWIDR